MRAGVKAVAVVAMGLGAVMAASLASADVYKCKDAQGNITFVDAPCPNDQNTVGHKVTNDANTLGKEGARSVATTKERRSKTTTAVPASASGSAPSSSGGCDSQRQRYVRMQSQNCIEALRVVTGKVDCMSPVERRDYLERLKSTIDAVCN